MALASLPFVAARQSSPAPELGEGVLNLVERGDGGEAGAAGWWRLGPLAVAYNVYLDAEGRFVAIGMPTS